MDNLIPVEGMDGYFRDIHSGAIVNKNNLEYNLRQEQTKTQRGQT